MQVIHDLRPRYIIDLGSSQGGSAVWFASMLKLFEIPGKARFDAHLKYLNGCHLMDFAGPFLSFIGTP